MSIYYQLYTFINVFVINKKYQIIKDEFLRNQKNLMSDRIYSEDEVRKLIRRAVQLEADRSDPAKEGSKSGLRISELKEVAANSGIDPELIEEAAKEMNKINQNTDKKIKVDKKEIVAESWLDIKPSSNLLNDLIVELNHLYNTSHDEITWWNTLTDNYSGKARIRKTGSNFEWHYTDELEYYTTRVLLQERGDRFRIRVSQQLTDNSEWDQSSNTNFYVFSILGFISVSAGLSTFAFLDSFWIGLTSGVVLSLLCYPVTKKLVNRSIQKSLDKHKNEVKKTVNHLTELATQISEELKSGNYRQSNKELPNTQPEPVDIPDENEKSDPGKTRLRNNLR